MTFEEIIKDFAESDVVPERAIKAALAEPAGFVDKAVPLLERIAATTSSDEEDSALAVLVHVLGEIGDARAFPPLMRMLRLPSDELDVLLGDSITETLANVLISLAGDSAAALEQALEDTRMDEFARSAIFSAWTRLVLDGTTPIERAKTFLADYPIRVGLGKEDFGWSSWVDSITALGLADLTGVVRRHLPEIKGKTSVLDNPVVSFEDFEQQLAATLADRESWRNDRNYRPFSGTIEELSRWYGYSEEFRQKRGREYRDDDLEEALSLEDRLGFGAPYIAANPYRDVGRNDPCPCGSGKKFKKCCAN